MKHLAVAAFLVAACAGSQDPTSSAELVELGRLEDALRALDRAIELQPENAEHHFKRSNILSSSAAKRNPWQPTTATSSCVRTLTPGTIATSERPAPRMPSH